MAIIRLHSHRITLHAESVVEILNIPGHVILKESITRKYPLRGYILGVLAHETVLDQFWGGAETLKWQFLEM